MNLKTGKAATGRQKIIAGVLVVLALLLLWRSWPEPAGGGDGDSLENALRTNQRSPGRRSGPAPGAVEVRNLHLAALDPEGSSFEVGRNLWAYYTPPPPPPPPPPPVVQREVRTTPPPPPPPQGPQLPKVTVDYVGYFGPEARRIAVFTDGETIYNVREGGILQEKFIVERIGLESVYLKYVDFLDLPAKQLKAEG